MNDILFAAFHDELEKLSASKPDGGPTVTLRRTPYSFTLPEVRFPDGTVLPELKTNPSGNMELIEHRIPDTVRELTPAEKAHKRGMARRGRVYPLNKGPQVTRSKAKKVVDTLRKLRR
jgi:hypothetical protein